MINIDLLDVILIFVFQINFANVYYIPHYELLILVMSLGVAIYLIMNIKLIINNFNGAGYIALIWSIIIFISYILNREINVSLLSAPLLIFKIISIILLCLIIKVKGKQYSSIRILFNCSLFWCVITDAIALLLPNLYASKGMYIIGNKFDVVYLHLLALALYMFVSRSNNKNSVLQLNIFTHKINLRLGYIILFVINLFLFQYFDCTTGIIALISYGVLYLFYNYKLTHNFWIMLITIGFFDSFFFLFPNIIVENDFINNLVVNTLNSSVTMTGRTAIYEKIWGLVLQKPWFGFGMGNANKVISNYIYGMPDAQNGIVQCLIIFGILGVIAMLLYFGYILTKTALPKELVCLFYAFCIISSVEIVFSAFLYSFIALGIMFKKVKVR